MLSINARQLPSYGGSLETAAADMEHYLAAGSGVLVLCGNETRARNFHRLLEERGVRARLDLSDQTLPAAGETVIGLGALSAGCEYPQLRLVILTEGQLLCAGQRQSAARGAAEKGFEPSEAPLLHRPDAGRPRRSPAPRHRPLCRHGAASAWTARTRIMSKSPISRQRHACTFPATQLDMVSKYIGSHGGGEEGEHVKLNKLGGDGLDEGQIPRQGRGEGSCQGAYQALRRTAAPPRLRLFGRTPPWQRGV